MASRYDFAGFASKQARQIVELRKNLGKNTQNGNDLQSLPASIELAYLISKSSLEKIKSAEYIKIPYVNWKGHNRNYIPDYIEENNLIEIKPKSFLGTIDNKAKFEAAKNIVIHII